MSPDPVTVTLVVVSLIVSGGMVGLIDYRCQTDDRRDSAHVVQPSEVRPLERQLEELESEIQACHRELLGERLLGTERQFVSSRTATARDKQGTEFSNGCDDEQDRFDGLGTTPLSSDDEDDDDDASGVTIVGPETNGE